MAKNKNMWTSVSAITDADTCMRRWWFAKVVKLPQKQRKATIFGDVFHAVCERFLKADDRGLDVKTQQPVNLYPSGWQTMKSRFDKDNILYTVSDIEAALIKVLIYKAIADGVLIREPGRIVEKDIDRVIYSQGYMNVVLKGFVDLDSNRGITDHKTAKNTNYILSLAKLKKSIQMMGYAYEKLLSGHEGSLWLSHNNFIKDFDKPIVIQRSVEVTEFEIRAFFNDRILPLIKQMLEYHLQYPKTLVCKWKEIQGAYSKKECNYYFGKDCPYLSICSETSTFDEYLRVFNMTLNQIIGNTQKKKGSIKMAKKSKSLIERIKSINSKATPQAPAQEMASTVPVEQAVEVIEEPQPSQAVGGLSAMIAKITGQASKEPATAAVAPSTQAVEGEPVKQRAPWYTEFSGQPCIACKDNSVLGFNSKMNPCMVCNARAKELGNPTSTDYIVKTNDEGILKFVLSEGKKETTEVKVVEQPTVKTSMEAITTSTVESPTTQLPSLPLVGDAPPMPSVKQPQVEMQELKEGFTLMVGCVYLNPYTDILSKVFIMNADDILKNIIADIESVAGKPVASIEHFVLMQAIDASIANLLKDLSGSVVVAVKPSKGSALERLIDGLRPYAENVIYPLGI